MRCRRGRFQNLRSLRAIPNSRRGLRPARCSLAPQARPKSAGPFYSLQVQHRASSPAACSRRTADGWLGNMNLKLPPLVDMALLASFSSSRESIIPDSLRARLRTFALLEDIGESALRRLLAEADWFGLPGGTQLPREGENDRAVFLVVTGSLGVFVEEDEGPRRLVATVPAGETVGEMSLLTGEPHSATLIALRDTELLRIGPKSFDMLLTRYPRVMLNLLKLTVRRLRQTTRGGMQHSRPKTFAVVPLQRGLRDATVARGLAETLIKMGAKAAVLDSAATDETTEWFNRFEVEHDVVFYQGDEPDSTWTSFCLRQADRVLLVARADEKLPLHPFERRFFNREVGAQPELLLLHPSSNSRPGLPQHIELRSDLFGTHHHIRTGNTSDIKRLAR